MKKSYIGGIQKFSTEDGPGIRTTVFLKGCPLACKWCHNPELINEHFQILYDRKKCIQCGECIKACPKQAIHFEEKQKDGQVQCSQQDELNGKMVVDPLLCDGCEICLEHCCSGALSTKAVEYDTEELMDIIRQDKEFYDNTGGGVTLSGGEILYHGEYAIYLAKRIKKEGYHLAIETSGFGKRETLLELSKLSNTILFDLKSMDIETHKKYIGADPKLIWDNLDILTQDAELKEKIRIRLPMIHGVNDTEENVQKVGEFMQSHDLHQADLLPYHNMGISKARCAGITQREFETPDDETLRKRKEQLEKYQIQVHIMGVED